MTDTATLQSRLEEAETALHKLSTGAQVASARNDLGEQVTYAPADIGKLSAYIRALKAELGQPRRRAIGVGFR